jgi:serine/threonine-protein kinase
VLGALGHGAMGRVLLGRDPGLDRDVAVKLLREDLKLTPEERTALYERMRQEARASARLAHPNIVGLYDIGEEPGLGLYLVFEYVDGPTLEQRITAGALGARAAAKLCRELGAALDAAHRSGVLHRDIKPANVILAEPGAKIADFGIARIPGSTLTQDGRVLGTPAYSAPESIETGEFSPASDQFSLAATLYEAISGKRAFPGDDAISVAKLIVASEPPAIAEAAGVDPHVDEALARGLHKDPRRRYGSANALGAALAEALMLAPRSAMPTLPDTRRQEARDARDSRRDTTLLTLGVVLGASLATSAFLLWPEREPGPVEPRGALPARVTVPETPPAGMSGPTGSAAPAGPGPAAPTATVSERGAPDGAASVGGK